MSVAIKMIVTDLDRTLLRSDKTISSYTVDVLKQYRDRGIIVVFATARPRRTVVEYCNLLNPDGVILHNGAVVDVNGDTLISFSIQPSIYQRIFQKILSEYPNAKISAEIDDALYANFDVAHIWNISAYMTTDFRSLPRYPADKLLISFNYPDIITDSYMKCVENYLPDDLYAQVSEGKIIMIMHRLATKYNAIQALSAHFSIAISDIVAFGDDYNDIEMLSNCGIGVAVGNALDEVKAAADYVCVSNDEDGVARWLEQALEM